MESKILEERRHSLEEEFFRKQSEQQRETLRQRKAREDTHEALRVAGVSDAAVRDRLIDAGLDAEAVAALELVPLIAVAWADEHLDARERDAVLRAADERRLTADHPAHQLLQGWLERAPAPALLDAWEAYVRALCGAMDPGAARAFRDQLLGQTRDVARAAGSLLGITSGISAREQAVLDRLSAAFGPA